MYRSISTNRFSDDNYSYYNSSSSPSSKVPTALRTLSSTTQQGGSEVLPMYEPLSEAAKKEKARSNFAEKAVHAIPFVLLLCAFILWMFSNPDIDLKGSSVAKKVQGMASKGNLARDDTGHLPLHLGDLQDPANLRDTNTIFSQKTS